MEVAFSITLVAVAFAAGFYLIYLIEKDEIYNLFTAILFPSILVFTLWLLSSLMFIKAGYLLIFLFPFLLISAILGGVSAHHKRKKQHSSL